MATLIKSPSVGNEPFVLGSTGGDTSGGSSLKSSVPHLADERQFQQIKQRPVPLSAERPYASSAVSGEASPQVDGSDLSSLRTEGPVSPTARELEEMRRAAKEEIEALKSDATQRGREEGFAAGREEGRAEYVQGLIRLEAAIQALTEQHSSVLRDAEQMIGEIIFSAVTRIIGQRATTLEGVSLFVDQALSQVRLQDALSVRLSPRDVAIFSEQSGNDGENLTFNGIPVVADDDIAMGGCVVDLIGGSLDARIETQFKAFAQSLKDHWGKT